MNSQPASSRMGIESHVWRLATVVILGSIMSILDTTIVNVALDTLGRDLHTTIASIQWVVTGYLLALAAVIPLTGWASRRIGTKRLYMLSLVLFTAGSALCGLAWSPGSLIVFRVLQGLGGGMVMPTGQMILARAAGPQRMGRVLSVVGVPMVLAPVLGPAFGGLLLDHVGWRSIFFINLPVGVVALALATRLLPAADEDEPAGRLDRVGFVLLATGLPALTYGLAELGSGAGAGSPRVLTGILGGLVLIAAFGRHALRIERPLLDVRLLAKPAFAAASITTFCLGAALFGAMILMPLYYQTVRGDSAALTGLLLAPQGVGAAIAMPLSGRLTDRVGGGRVAFAGVVLTALGTLPFAFIGAGTSLWLISGALVLRGFGIGVAIMPAMSAAYATLRPAQITDAAPQLTVVQRVGGSLGTALFAVVLSHKTAHLVPAPHALATAFASTYWWVLGVTVAALLPALALIRAQRVRVTDVTGSPQPEAEAA